MSINDLLDSDVFIPAMAIIFVIIVIFAIPAGIDMSKKTNKNIYGDDESDSVKEEKNAKVLALRTFPHPLNPTIMVNTVLFQLTNGVRLELAIKEYDVFATMIEGDCGLLKYQEKRFISFERNV